MFKKYIQKRLQKYVRAYFAKHPEVKLVVVAGSVGKTSTKLALATVLSQRFRVRLHEGNHNTAISVPIAILGIDYPDNIRRLGAWWSVFRAAKQRVNQPTDVDIIIQELGIDHPGEMAQFAEYLAPDLAVVTAITPEHMEFFETLDTVAREELSVTNFSRLALINRDDISGQYAALITNPSLDTYGTSGVAEYRFVEDDYTPEQGFTGSIIAPEIADPIPVQVHLTGEHSIRPVIAAAAVGAKFGMSAADISQGVALLKPVSGRMNILRGVNNSIIIDDTYNSSPAAAVSALQALYTMQTPQRIAILGSMNELGQSSQLEHEALGKMCDPNALSWVVVVGDEATTYLAPAARAQGCQVQICRNALEAGAFVHKVVEDQAVILVKGSEGNIFLEEAVKILLHTNDDDRLLVRQSPAWMARKDAFFSAFH